MLNLIKKFIKDQRGSVLPMIAVILILVIFIGCANFALVIMYRDRAAVRNALDAGVSSSMASVAKEKWRGLYYGEGTVTTKKERVDYEKLVTVGHDEEGNSIREWKNFSKLVSVEEEWRGTQVNKKNYVHLPVGQGSTVAKQYFEDNIDLNRLPADIISWDYSVKYDDQRTYEVEKYRTLVPFRPYFVEGTPPRGGRNYDFGIPDEYNKVENPESWWLSEFAGADTRTWDMREQKEWTELVHEKREIIFPRWVEVKAKVKVELPIPFGQLLKKPTYQTSFEFVAFKELIEVVD